MVIRRYKMVSGGKMVKGLNETPSGLGFRVFTEVKNSSAGCLVIFRYGYEVQLCVILSLITRDRSPACRGSPVQYTFAQQSTKLNY